MGMVDMFLKLDGIKGESKDDKHAGEISVLDFSWGVTNHASFQVGHSGGGVGKADVHNMHMTKFVDTSSPALMLHTCNGKHIKSAIITFRKQGEKPLDFLTITLTDVLLASYVPAMPHTSNELMKESFGLCFAKVEYDYVPQKQDGTGDSPIKSGWDVMRQTKV